MDNTYTFSSNPQIKEYRDGLLLEGIILGSQFLYWGNQWFLLEQPCYNLLKIKDESGTAKYFMINLEHLKLIPEDKTLKMINNNESEDSVTVILMVWGF